MTHLSLSSISLYAFCLARVCTHACTYTPVQRQACTRTRIHARKHTHEYTHTQMYMRARTHNIQQKIWYKTTMHDTHPRARSYARTALDRFQDHKECRTFASCMHHHAQLTCMIWSAQVQGHQAMGPRRQVSVPISSMSGAVSGCMYKNYVPVCARACMCVPSLLSRCLIWIISFPHALVCLCACMYVCVSEERENILCVDVFACARACARACMCPSPPDGGRVHAFACSTSVTFRNQVRSLSTFEHYGP